MGAMNCYPNARVLLGFALAPAPAAAIFATFLAGEGMSLIAYLGWAGITLLIAWLWTFILGLPIYFFLKRIAALGLVSSVSAGCLIAAGPAAVLMLGNAGGSFIAGGKVFVQQGRYTIDGYVSVFQSIAGMGMLGLLSGFLFWLIAVRR